MRPPLALTSLGLAAAALAACANGRDGAGSRGAALRRSTLTMPQKGTVQFLAVAPDLGWHRGGYYAFTEAPGDRAVVSFSTDGESWDRFALVDRAGQVFGAVFTNPADGYVLHGNADATILYRASFAFGNRELKPAARLTGRYIRLLPEPNPNKTAEPALWILGSDAEGRGTVLRTLDGSALEPIARFEGNAPALVAGAARWKDRTILVGGAGGVGALYASERGAPFRKLTREEIPNLLAVDFDPGGRGLAVGARGEVLRSSDGGESWEATLSGTAADLADVRFLGERRAILCGRGGTVLATDDAGSTFRTVALGRREDFFGLVPAAGGGGVFLLGASGSVPFVGDRD